MRKIFVTLMLLAVLMISGMAFAQEATTCPPGLDDATCTLLDESNAAMSTIKSVAFDFTISVAVEEEVQPLFTGNGAAAGDFDGVDFSSLDTNDVNAVVGVLPELLGRFQGELNMNLAGMLPLELRLVDGVGYLNFAGLAPLLGGPEALQAQGLPTGWAGLNLIEVIGNLAPMLESAAGELPETDPVDPAEAEAQAAAMAEAAAQYLTSSAAVVDNTTVITSNLDLAGFISDPAFAELIEQQIEAQAGMTGGEVSSEDVVNALQNSTFIITQTIDNNSKFLTGLTFDLGLDAQAFGELVGETAPEGAGPVLISGVITVRDHNAVAPIAAPEGPVATFAELMQLFGGMGGGF